MEETRRVQAETMIAVSDVERSSAWYQQLLGVRSIHGGPHFDCLVDPDGTPVLLLHHWGAHEHPTMGDKNAGPCGHGLILYFRVAAGEELQNCFVRARAMNAEVVDEPRWNEIAHQQEFSVRDPDGYWMTVCWYREGSPYEGV